MIETKIFEVRDRATFLPVLCVRVAASYRSTMGGQAKAREDYLIRRSGYSEEPLVVLTPLAGGGSTFDPYDWEDRTRSNAHAYIQEHWEELQSGDLIDVRVVLGEASQPCESEFVTCPLN